MIADLVARRRSALPGHDCRRGSPRDADHLWGRVFALGSTGILNCLDLTKTGRAIWRRDIGADNDSPQPEWGRSSSPLIVDDLVVVSAGGPAGRSLVAYHRDSGEPVWKAGDDQASYSSPALQLGGVRQIVVLNQSTVAGHDLQTGRVLWTHAWPRPAPSVAVPLILSEGRVLVSAGYGMGSRLLEISRAGDALTQALVWESPRLKAKFTNPVFHDGFVYGLDDGVLVCLDPSNGERCWKGGRYGHGQTLLVGNRLLVQTEDGEMVLVDASPAAHREIARFRVFGQDLESTGPRRTLSVRAHRCRGSVLRAARRVMSSSRLNVPQKRWRPA